jgi:hypothetical protein
VVERGEREIEREVMFQVIINTPWKHTWRFSEFHKTTWHVRKVLFHKYVKLEIQMHIHLREKKKIMHKRPK